MFAGTAVALHGTQLLALQIGALAGHCECAVHCTHWGAPPTISQNGWPVVVQPELAPLSPTLHRTQAPPLAAHTFGAVQSPARHVRQVREAGSQIGMPAGQSPAIPGLHCPQLLFCGIPSGMKQRWLPVHPPVASQRTQRPLAALQMGRTGFCKIVASAHHVVPPPAEFGTRLQPRHVPVVVSHHGVAELVLQSLSLRHCTQRPLLRLQTWPLPQVPFMHPWHW